MQIQSRWETPKSRVFLTRVCAYLKMPISQLRIHLGSTYKRTGIITLWQTQHGFRALSRQRKKLWAFEVPRLSQNDKNSFSQLSPKLSTIGPMFINNININVPIPHLLSLKRSLYDFHSSS